MPLAKVIEVIAEGPTIEEAVSDAATQAGKTVRDIQNVYVKDMKAIVENGKVVRYRVNTKVTFLVHGSAT